MQLISLLDVLSGQITAMMESCKEVVQLTLTQNTPIDNPTVTVTQVFQKGWRGGGGGGVEGGHTVSRPGYYVRSCKWSM